MTCRALFTPALVFVLTISVEAQSLEEIAARERNRRARQSPGVPSYDDQDLNKGKPSPSPSPSPGPTVTPRPSVPSTQAAPLPGTAATPAPGRIRGGRLPSPRPTSTPKPVPSVAPSPGPSAGPSAAPSAGPAAGPSSTPPPTALPTPPPPPPVAAGTEASEAYWRGRARELREAVANAERQVAALESRVNALRNDMAPTDAMQASREQQRRAALGQAIAELEQAKAAVVRARQALEDLDEEARRKGALPGWLREQ